MASLGGLGGKKRQWGHPLGRSQARDNNIFLPS
jgi:hypothetical protein